MIKNVKLTSNNPRFKQRLQYPRRVQRLSHIINVMNDKKAKQQILVLCAVTLKLEKTFNMFFFGGL